MQLQHHTKPPATDDEARSPMIRSMLRSLALAVAIGAVLFGCSNPSGASSSWSFGPSLPPASGEASAGPGPSVVPSAAPSAPPSPPASPGALASASPSALPAGDATQLTIGTRTGDEQEFEPDEVSVPAGVQVAVTFENLSSLAHNLTFNEPINVATSPAVAPGASETVQFAAPEPGDYTFVCTIHPGMQGTLTVEPGA